MTAKRVDLPPRMQEFLEIEKGTEKNDDTINSYRNGLALFTAWLNQEGLSYEEATTRDIKRYLSYLKEEKEYAPNTIRGKFTAISQFYDDLVEAGERDENPTERVTLADYAPKVTKKEELTKEKRIWLSKDEIKQLVKHAPPPRLRNRLIILLQYYTALRRQEIANIRLEDIDREKRQIQVRGKGDKIHTAYYQPRLDGLLAKWIDGMGHGEGRENTRYADESPYLFPTNYAEKIGDGTINKIVVEAAENAGIQEVLYTDASGRKHNKVSSHTLRHSFAMHYLQNGGSIEGLSKLLAHTSVTTTEIYGEILEERANEEYQESAPDIDFTL